MNRPRIARALRIAWSLLWGIAAVLLIVLWVRSYWWEDHVYYDGEDSIAELSFQMGDLIVSAHGVKDDNPFDGGDGGLLFTDGRIESDESLSHTGFSRENGSISLPVWFCTFVIGSLGVVPWLPWRFSVRTLLIATTLVAVGLGLIVWAARAR